MTEWTLGASLLFCPADRPERYEKALAAADTVILDLEDAVAAVKRPEAREALLKNPVDPSRVIVRVNPRTTADYDEDIRTLRQTEYRVIMLAKAESAEQVTDAAPFQVVALCETARGVLAAPEIVRAPNIAGVMWGAEDLMASIGGSGSRLPDGRYRDIPRYAKSTVLLNAAVAGVPAIDTVFLDVPDKVTLRAEADEAVASGFVAKACIHPSQAGVVREAFQPSADEVSWARKVVAGSAESAVFLLDGQMIDAPLVAQARQILRRADA